MARMPIVTKVQTQFKKDAKARTRYLLFAMVNLRIRGQKKKKKKRASHCSEVNICITLCSLIVSPLKKSDSCQF